MMGGEGVGVACRYLWYTPHSEKAKLTIPRRTNGTIEKRKRKTQGERQDDHTEVC
jgi:hypothetical protein